jgi:hypothetical protein
MNAFCHRCGGDLPVGNDVSPFCPHCGSPQIYLQDYEQQTSASEADTTGALPPPRPRQVEWKTAIRCALLVAGVAAVLGLISTRVEAVSPLSWLWTMSGSLIALALYQRRRPQAWMDAGIGARIGLLVGLALTSCFGMATAVGGLVARFGLHSLAGFDTDLTQQLQLFHAQVEKASAGNPQPPQFWRFIATPEFRAGFVLAMFATAAVFLLVLSTVGGAVGGLLRTRRKVSA